MNERLRHDEILEKLEEIKKLIQKAVEDEREACALVCEGLHDKRVGYAHLMPREVAEAIRARGNHDSQTDDV